MKEYFKVLVILSFVSLGACATLVKSEKIPVHFVGGLQEGDTQINLPDGQFTVKNGQTTVLVSRSKEDIPVSVTCNKETREGVIQTKYDAVAGILGNVVFGGIIGMGIDAYNDKTYDPPGTFNLSPLCMHPETPLVDNKDSVATRRNPSSAQMKPEPF